MLRGCAIALSIGGLTLWAQNAPGQESRDGTLVKIAGFESRTPADWIREKPSNRLRSFQFRLPRAKGDKEDAELGVLPDLPGRPEENLERWKELFVPPDGKTVDDIARVEKFKVGKVAIVSLDIAGTYLQKDRPLGSKSVPKPHYRMISIIFDTPDGAALIRVVGPEATMAKHKGAFDAWVKAFK
jgi:hypothetical protein